MENVKKHYKSVILLVLLLGLGVLLFTVNIKDTVMAYTYIELLKENLDFINEFFKRYSYVIVWGLLLVVYLWGRRRISITVPKVSIAGFEINFKFEEKTVRANVKNYLNTKRSLFYCAEEYDNYYDVINSFYEIYCFLRTQMNGFENFANTKSDCYLQIEKMILVLNIFLTQYQSDYRRWYEKNVNSKKKFGKAITDIQKEYFKYGEMTAALKELNVKMQQSAKYFDIDTEKWKDIYE